MQFWQPLQINNGAIAIYDGWRALDRLCSTPLPRISATIFPHGKRPAFLESFSPIMLRKRLVIQFTGYEGLHPKAVRIRHAQASRDFDRLWNAKTKLSPMTDEPDDCGSLQANTRG